jgi:hypothetical protein
VVEEHEESEVPGLTAARRTQTTRRGKAAQLETQAEGRATLLESDVLVAGTGAVSCEGALCEAGRGRVQRCRLLLFTRHINTSCVVFSSSLRVS